MKPFYCSSCFVVCLTGSAAIGKEIVLSYKFEKRPDKNKCVDPPLARGFATLPYIKGLTEPLTRLLKKQDIQVTNKPVKTLQQEFPAPKFRPEKVDQCNVVYKIPCTTCSWSYIGETRRSFSTRKKEHARNVKMCTKGSNVANHAGSENHQIDFENVSIIDKSNYRHLKTLESWHTAKTVDADNNSCPLPSLTNIAFFLTNNAFHTYHLYYSYFVFI